MQKTVLDKDKYWNEVGMACMGLRHTNSIASCSSTLRHIQFINIKLHLWYIVT